MEVENSEVANAFERPWSNDRDRREFSWEALRYASNIAASHVSETIGWRRIRPAFLSAAAAEYERDLSVREWNRV